MRPGLTEAQIRAAIARCDEQIKSADALLKESREAIKVALALKRSQAQKKRVLVKRLRAMEKASAVAHAS